MKRYVAIFIAALPLFAALAPAAPGVSGQGRGRIRRADNAVPNEYIVVLKEEVEAGDVTVKANELAWRHMGVVRFHYTAALKGFSVRMSEGEALALSRHPLVDFVEENGSDPPSGSQSPTPSWGLDRIDRRTPALNGAYIYANTGAGVHAYVIDTGINVGHRDFAGRIGQGIGYIDDGNWLKDCNGHGTGVASVLGGATHGVAKGVTIHPVRIAGCDGRANKDTKVMALDYVAANHVKPAVTNYSWNNLRSLDTVGASAIDRAAGGLVAAGVTLVNSAGNDGRDASAYSPTGLAEVLVAAATQLSVEGPVQSPTAYDTRAIFSTFTGSSNHGAAVDLYAPGKNITCAAELGPKGEQNLTQKREGTSFAAPHVAGAAALYLESNPAATPAQVQSYLTGRASNGLVRDVPSGPNKFLYTGP